MNDYTFDLSRIFLGDMPLLFYVEIALRALILYGYALVIFRLLGKRSAGELTVLDVLLIIALGTAVGDPMIYTDIPLLQGIMVITLIVGLQRLALYWANRNPRVDRFLKGRPSLVASQGMLNLEGMEHIGMSKREIFQIARQSGYRNLGQIKRMYIETDDKASIYGYEPDQIRPGLPFEPPFEMDDREPLKTGSTMEEAATLACTDCGKTIEVEAGNIIPPCPRCQARLWILAE